MNVMNRSKCILLSIEIELHLSVAYLYYIRHTCYSSNQIMFYRHMKINPWGVKYRVIVLFTRRCYMKSNEQRINCFSFFFFFNTQLAVFLENTFYHHHHHHLHRRFHLGLIIYKSYYIGTGPITLSHITRRVKSCKTRGHATAALRIFTGDGIDCFEVFFVAPDKWFAGTVRGSRVTRHRVCTVCIWP